MGTHFVGDFDILPLAAHFECGPVPTHPTGEAFQLAAIGASHDGSGIITIREAALVWHREAIRWRLGNAGAALDLPAIAQATSAELYQRTTP